MAVATNLLLALALGTSSPGVEADPVPQRYGWHQVPDTRLHDVCPPDDFKGSGYAFSGYCRNVTAAWGGAAYDAARSRLYMWGGGHNDYYGNEVYALDLKTETLHRLTDPALPIADRKQIPAPAELFPFDGTQPNSRHTYDGIVFLAHADRLWAYGGSLAGYGNGGDTNVWIFDPNSNTWKAHKATGELPEATAGIVTAYDQKTGKVYVHDRKGLFAYEYSPEGGHFTRLSRDSGFGLHATAVIDPVRDRFVIIGNRAHYYYDLGPGSSYQRHSFEASGDLSITSFQAPGLAFDPVTQEIVAWVGNGRIYRLDPDTWAWKATAFGDGPGPQHGAGTYGRFAYLPEHDAFVVYNDVKQNAYTFKPPRDISDTEPPASPPGVTATALLPRVVRISWQVAQDNFGVASYRVYRGGQLLIETDLLRHYELDREPGRSYSYTVTAVDSAGNESAPSLAVVADMPLPSVSLPLGDCAAETQLKGRGDVVLCEPWESADWWTNGYLEDPIVADPRAVKPERVQRTSIVSAGCFSGKCLRIETPKGQTGSLSVHWPLKAAELAPEQLYLRYYMKLGANWTPQMCDENGNVVGAGGKFPGLADPRTWADPGGQCGNGGARGDGINCWSARSNFRGCATEYSQACQTKPGAVTRFGSYVYHYGQTEGTGQAGNWDDDPWAQSTGSGGTCETVANNMYCGIGDGGVLVPDKWYRIEIQIKMNTPGQEDGVIRGWVDGVLSYEKTNTVFRLSGHDMLHNRTIWLNVFKGGSKGNCEDSAIFLDQLVATTDAPPGGLDSDTPQPPSLVFDAEPRSVALGDPVRLGWTATDATACEASGAWSGPRPTSGSEQATPMDARTLYRLDCTGPGGAVSRIVPIDVVGGENPEPQPPPPPAPPAPPAPPPEADIEPPAIPDAPRPVLITESRIDVTWPVPDDNVGVVGYRVFKDGALAATVIQNGYSDTNLGPGETHGYAVQAFDAANNLSKPSAQTLLTTIDGLGTVPTEGVATVYPSADTHLDPSTVVALGDRTTLQVSGSKPVYVRFALGTIPATARIVSARLRIHDRMQYGAIARLGVFRADKGWHESVATRDYYDHALGLSWKHFLGDWFDALGAPQGDTPFDEADVPDIDSGQWVELDVTALVQGWIDGSYPNKGLVLRSLSGSGTHSLDSRETSDPDRRPHLQIELAPATGDGAPEGSALSTSGAGSASSSGVASP